MPTETRSQFLRVSRPELELPDGADPYAPGIYQRANDNFAALRDSSLVLEDEPSVYFYRLRMDRHTQTGLAACFSLDEYDRDVIKKHERTRRDKEDDRTRHMVALRAQTGPVFLTYRAHADVAIVLVEGKAGGETRLRMAIHPQAIEVHARLVLQHQRVVAERREVVPRALVDAGRVRIRAVGQLELRSRHAEERLRVFSASARASSVLTTSYGTAAMRAASAGFGRSARKGWSVAIGFKVIVGTGDMGTGWLPVTVPLVPGAQVPAATASAKDWKRASRLGRRTRRTRDRAAH